MKETLAESVRLHLASDVPLGVFLSGGVDSSAVANLAQRAGDRPVNTFTLAFEEAEYNESHHASAVAKAIGSEHHELTLTVQRKGVDQSKPRLARPAPSGKSQSMAEQGPVGDEERDNGDDGDRGERPDLQRAIVPKRKIS